MPDPLAVRRDPEQVLSDQQAQQLDIVEPRLPARRMRSREADRRENPVIEVDIEWDKEGVEVGFHTQGLTPSVRD
ncbi:hypothetical protein GCM10028798_27000 [Humibacter antri]